MIREYRKKLAKSFDITGKPEYIILVKEITNNTTNKNKKGKDEQCV